MRKCTIDKNAWVGIFTDKFTRIILHLNIEYKFLVVISILKRYVNYSLSVLGVLQRRTKVLGIKPEGFQAFFVNILPRALAKGEISTKQLRNPRGEQIFFLNISVL